MLNVGEDAGGERDAQEIRITIRIVGLLLVYITIRIVGEDAQGAEVIVMCLTICLLSLCVCSVCELMYVVYVVYVN